jgi:hypothetical protein
LSRPRPARRYPDRRRTALLWLLAVLVIGFFGLLIFLTGHISVIEGRRTMAGGPVDATLTNSFLRIVPLSSTELPGLSQARLEVVPDRKNSTKPTFHVLFDSDSGVVEMTSFSRGGRDAHQGLVDEINAHLADPREESFTIVHNGSGWLIALPIAASVLLVVGLMVWILVRIRRALLPPAAELPA